MTKEQFEVYLEALFTSKGHDLAFNFIQHFCNYCHMIDDMIDNNQMTPDSLLRLLQKAADIYSHRFYLEHNAYLYPLVRTITNTYADSVEFEKETSKPWQKQYADVLRHTATDMTIFIVGMIFGWEKQREVSLLYKQVNYDSHHTKEGVAI